MRLVEWQDDRGFKHLSWLRSNDGDDAVEQGIPHDPPDVASLKLSKKQALALNHALVARQLVAWRDETLLKRAVEEALKSADLPTDLAPRVVELYADRRVTRDPGYEFNIDFALRTANLSAEQKNCIRNAFASARIKTLANLENAPTKTGHICGTDIYQLVAHILAWA
jgi:hypothetical protein